MRQQALSYLADPVRVLAGLNYFAAGCCLVAGWAFDGLPGFIFGAAGTWIIVTLRRI